MDIANVNKKISLPALFRLYTDEVRFRGYFWWFVCLFLLSVFYFFDIDRLELIPVSFVLCVLAVCAAFVGSRFGELRSGEGNSLIPAYKGFLNDGLRLIAIRFVLLPALLVAVLFSPWLAAIYCLGCYMHFSLGAEEKNAVNALLWLLLSVVINTLLWAFAYLETDGESVLIWFLGFVSIFAIAVLVVALITRFVRAVWAVIRPNRFRNSAGDGAFARWFNSYHETSFSIRVAKYQRARQSIWAQAGLMRYSTALSAPTLHLLLSLLSFFLFLLLYSWLTQSEFSHMSTMVGLFLLWLPSVAMIFSEVGKSWQSLIASMWLLPQRGADARKTMLVMCFISVVTKLRDALVFLLLVYFSHPQAGFEWLVWQMYFVVTAAITISATGIAVFQSKATLEVRQIFIWFFSLWLLFFSSLDYLADFSLISPGDLSWQRWVIVVGGALVYLMFVVRRWLKKPLELDLHADMASTE